MKRLLKQTVSILCTGALVAVSPGVKEAAAIAVKVVPAGVGAMPGASAGAAVLGGRTLSAPLNAASPLQGPSLPTLPWSSPDPFPTAPDAEPQTVAAPASARFAAPAAGISAVRPAAAPASGEDRPSAMRELRGLSPSQSESPAAAPLDAAFDGAKGYEPGGSNADWEAVPLQFRPSQDVMKGLNKEQREDASEVSSLARARLFLWGKSNFSFPKSVFSDKDGSLVKVGDLFRRPTGDAEVERIGSERRRFTPEQMASIQDDASFAVVSEEFPGQTHGWKIGGLVQRGARRIREDREKNLAAAYNHAAVQIPERLAGRGVLSLRRTLGDLAGGIADTLGLLVGRVRTEGLYPYEIRNRLAEARRHFVEIMAESRGADTVLLDRKLMEQAGKAAAGFDEEAARTWEKNKERTKHSIEVDLAGENLGEEAYRQALADRSASARNEILFSMLRKSPGLEALAPGLGAKLAARGKAVEIVRAEEAAFNRKLESFLARRSEQIREEHPIRSRVRAWMDKQVEASRRYYVGAHREAPYLDAGRALEAAGLNNDAAILAAERLFTRMEEDALLEKFSSERRPLHRYSFERVLWSKKNWKITRSDLTGTYRAQKTEAVAGASDHVGWRLLKAARRTYVWTMNAAHALMIGNALNGPLGLRSLVSVKPFPHRWDADEKTGELVAVGKPRQTLISRIGRLWESRREILEDHERKNNYGLFGKAFERFLLFFSADLGRGVIAPLAVLIGQPLLTALNVAASAGLAAASVAGAADISMILLGLSPVFTPWLGAALIWAAGLAGLGFPVLAAIGTPAFTGLNLAALAAIAWAPAVSLAILLFDALVFDTTNAYGAEKWYGRFLPWVRTLGLRTLWSGVAMTAVSAAALLAYHPAMALGAAAWAGVRSGVRTAYDAAMRGAIGRFGRVPGRDARFIVRRVRGPGLSSDFYYQIAPELALVAFWAGMERTEQVRYASDTAAKIAEPRRAYDAFVESLSAVTGKGSVRPDDDAPGLAEIVAAQKELTEKAAGLGKPNDELYSKLLDIESRGRIKLTEAHYKDVLAKASILAERFYGRLFASRGMNDAAVAAFWKEKGFTAGDWVSLAKSHLAEVFGDAFLVPLEESDKTLKVEVEAQGLGDYAAGLEDGILPEDLAKVRLGRIPKGTPGEERIEPLTPELEVRSILEPELARP